MWVISFYKFVQLDNIDSLREKLLAQMFSLDVKGTILIAPEGVNATISGEKSALESYILWMQEFPFFQDLTLKWSQTTHFPFTRTKVKIKREIIPLGDGSVEFIDKTAPHVDPLTLKQWLAEGKSVTLLDVRNNYEMNFGSFKNSIQPDVRTFKEFPEWLDTKFADKKKEVIVTFCTGGVRCEKATVVMRNKGYENVYQLDGGILNYLEQCAKENIQDTHYEGACFVFDGRVAVNQHLQDLPDRYCYHCWKKIEAEDRKTFEIHTHCKKCASEIATQRAHKHERKKPKEEYVSAP